MALLYADENFPHAVVEELRRLGHDVVTVQEAGQHGADDPAVLAVASAAGRAVLTFNRWHFHKLHAASSAHAGIVTCTKDDNAAALAQRIHQAIVPLPMLAGLLIRVVRPPQPPPPGP
jgi:hypothetical protein